MKNSIIILVFILATSIGYSQVSDSTEIVNQTETQPEYQKQEKPEKKTKPTSNRVFFGGSLGFSFGSVTSIRVYPMVGYKLTRKLSVGVKALYEYNSYETVYGDQSYNNYGGSAFGRIRFIPQAYAHIEYSYVNYEQSGFNNEKYRVGVPFLFLGGGYVQNIGNNAHMYFEILFDVLQDTNSPYSDWTPFYSIGVSVGI